MRSSRKNVQRFGPFPLHRQASGMRRWTSYINWMRRRTRYGIKPRQFSCKRAWIRPNASDHHYVIAAQALTAAWGLIAIGVASFASLVENLIEAGNILGSVFYGSILGLFLAAFFIRRLTGSAVFFAALVAQSLVFILFATTNIGYLWYNFIGCATVLIVAPVLQQTIFRSKEAPAGV